MPRAKEKEKEEQAVQCDCGPLQPKTGEVPIKEGTSAESLLSQIQLICDDDTAVFLFRWKRKLYMRVIECEAEE